MEECPCGLPASFTDCCGPFLRGTAYPDTAEQLMRSRYTAHVKRDLEYLSQTVCSDERKKDSSPKDPSEIVWTGLDVLSHRQGDIGDEEGEVTFEASYYQGEESVRHREISRFFREEGRWVYSQKESRIEIQKDEPERAKTFVRDQPKVGRNDPCPCNSGKKFKKCCGK